MGERQVNVPQLTSIYYNPVGTCNLVCRHCWVEMDSDRPAGGRFQQRDRLDTEIAPSDFATLLESAIPLGLRSVKFTGGEPFIRTDTIAMIELAAEKGLRTSIETNATLLDGMTIDRIAEVGPSQIAVSVDSADGDWHDAFRGAKGAHLRVTEAIRLLSSSGCNVQVIMAVMRRNMGGCSALVDLAESLGARSVKLCRVNAVGRGALLGSRGELLDAQEFIELHELFRRQKTRGIRVHVDVPPAFRPLCLLPSLSPCRMKNLLGLLPDGSVSYCGIGMTHPELVMGNLLRDDLSALWQESARLREIRDGLPRRLEGTCARCMMKSMCLGVCPVHSYAACGSLFAGNAFCEEAEGLGLFPAARLIPS